MNITREMNEEEDSVKGREGREGRDRGGVSREGRSHELGRERASDGGGTHKRGE